jgi:putative transcriptional regulator
LVEHQVDAGDIDPKAIRLKLKLTQERMAQVLGTSVSGYRKWEQAQRMPSGAARTLLRVMAKEPEAVLRALSDAA